MDIGLHVFWQTVINLSNKYVSDPIIRLSVALFLTAIGLISVKSGKELLFWNIREFD